MYVQCGLTQYNSIRYNNYGFHNPNPIYSPGNISRLHCAVNTIKLHEAIELYISC